MAEGFYDDPVMNWALRDDSTRLGILGKMFWGLAEDMLPPRGVIQMANTASVSLWRDPTFDHVAEAEAETAQQDADPDVPHALFTPDEEARFDELRAGMRETHPHEPHWYLNVLSTLPSHQSQGLGAAALVSVLVLADEAGDACYLESTNPRNRSLYRRHGFEDHHRVPFDGPDMLAMWRPAQT